LTYFVCVPYYSIPEFPSGCTIVKHHEIVARDVLLCNPTNFHVRGGIQYDPHVESMEYINCQPKARRSIAEKIETYGDVRILFRTRRLKLDGGFRHLVTGYYVVGSASEATCRDAPVIKASRIRFVAAPDAIDITGLLDRTGAYRSCFTTQNPRWEPRLVRWIRHIDAQRDATKKYVEETMRLKKIYGENEFRTGALYATCGDCSCGDGRCYLFRRRGRFGSLANLPLHYQ